MQAPGYYSPSQVPRPSAPPRTEEEGNVILCMVDNMMYPITEEALETVVKAYGDVVQRVIYERPGVWQAVVQYATAASANSAKQALEGHAIFEGGFNKLRVFSSSKHALAYATAAIAMPEYKLSEQEAANVRTVVNGDDYVRAHSDIGRGTIAALSGQPLPPSFIPTTIPPAGTQPPIGTVPVGGPQMYVRPSDPYINGPPPQGPYLPPAMSSAAYYHMQQPSNFPRMVDARYTRPIPMTTYQQHPVPHHMQPQAVTNRTSHSIVPGRERESERGGDAGPGMMSSGSDRSKQV